MALIVVVLGSILAGNATVDQAGSVGAVGATVMAGYRLMEGKRGAYYPAIRAGVSIVPIFYLLANYNRNIKNATPGDYKYIGMAAVAVTGLLIAILWSAWRTFRIEETLRYVCVETAKTTSMVFIILLGAAMLTAAFRGFGGEELVKDFLTGLPGGFWGQFIVVMAVIFVLGFFLDFIEIAVVVVPIMAPILLADPSANITAVWLGVMVGVNMQTSFLTPPFGFSLFYLRGVAPPSVRTTQIYRGAIAFILLQLAGLAIVGFNPGLVNYLPNRTYLTSETAPPPQNPRLQECLEEYMADYYDENEARLRQGIESMQSLDLSSLPDNKREELEQSFIAALDTFQKMDDIDTASLAVDAYMPEYRPIHRHVRSTQAEIRKIEGEIEEEQQMLNLETRIGSSESRLRQIRGEIEALQAQKTALEESIPSEWQDAREQFQKLALGEKTARLQYRRNVDGAYEPVNELNRLLAQAEDLVAIEDRLVALRDVVRGDSGDAVVETFKETESLFSDFDDVSDIRSAFSKVRREFRNDEADRDKAAAMLDEAIDAYRAEVSWRRAAATSLHDRLTAYEALLRPSIGTRLQPRLTVEQAEEVASCRSEHRDISPYF
ncbi:MAG: C4-dicarboxylate ABC transporter permease [Proteobacteria bacterium]|nr:MAG: C4-dicarboxylate ABC transporter permease [Pseudomonadota bacterium]